MSAASRAKPLPPDERREQILDCSLEVVARKGFHDTSIADICRAARIARGTLYQYFHDKRDVLKALIDRIVARITGAIQEWPPFELPPDGTWTEAHNIVFIEARCTQIMQVVFADAQTASLMLRMARGTGFAREALAQIDQCVVGVIEADIRAAVERGALRPVDPRIVAQFIVGGIEKIVVAALDAGQPLDAVQVAEEVAVLLSCGLMTGHRSSPPAGSGER